MHCVNSDKILSCEFNNVAQTTASKLVKDDLSTPKADKIHDNLHLNENKKGLVTLEDSLGGEYTQLLKEKVTQSTLNQR